MVDGRELTFSSFAYEFISFDLVLDGWIARKPALSAGETGILDNLPRLRGLMEECEVAAEASQNHRILDRISIVRDWLDALEYAITCRMKEDGIDFQ